MLHRAVEAMDRCLREGLEVLLQTIVTPWNYDELPQLIEFAYQEGARGFTLYYLVCTGRGEDLTDISPRQYEEALSRLIEARGQYPGMMIRARCAPQVRRIARERGSALCGSAGCLAATSYCRITPEGQVTR